MKMIEFCLKFNWNLFSRFQFKYSNIGSDNGLVPIRRQAIIWTHDGYITNAYMRPSASINVRIDIRCNKITVIHNTEYW